nr:MAG TPA: tail tape measure protein [Caudoviricetes sp.]
MRNIIAQQKEYSSELNATTASLGKNATAQERATSIAAVLRKQIEAQETALSAQTGMLQKAVAKYGEMSVEASAYRTAINKTNTDLANMKNRLSDAENGLGEFAAKTDKATESLQNFSGKSGKGIFDDLAGAVVKGNLIADAFEAAGSKAVDAGKKIINAGVSYNAQLEQYQVALTTMLGSQDAADSALEQIKQDAARTPFDTAGLVKANQLLISTGVDADSSRKVILALGDAVSATGGGNDELSRMAQNLQQIKNAGKATAADIKQFAYAGIDVYGILADYTGKSTAEAQKMTVSYELLTNALMAASSEGGRYYQAMETQSQTLNGRISTLKDNATQLTGSLTEGLTDGLGQGVELANTWVQELQESLQSNGAQGMIATGNALAGNAIDSFVDYANANMDGVVDTGLSIAAGLADGAVENAPKLVSAAGSLLESFGSKVIEDLPSILEKGGELTGKFAEGILSGAGDVVAAGGSLLEQLLEKLGSGDFWSAGLNAAKNFGRGLFEGAQNFTNAILSNEDDRKQQENAKKQQELEKARQERLKKHQDRVANADQWEDWRSSSKPKTSPTTSGTGTGGSGSGSGSTAKTKKAAADTKKLADSVTSTATELVTGTEGIVGAIKRVTETADNTYNVYDGTTKKLKGTTKETAQTITETWTQVVDGQEQNFKRVQTLLDGVVTSTKTTSDAVAEATRTATTTRTETVKGTENMVGNITRTTETTTQTAKTVDAVTGEIKDTVISATEVVTDCYTRIKDGQKQTVTETKTYVNGVLTDVKEKSQDLDTDIKYTEGVLGGFSKFIYDLDGKLGGLEKTAKSLKKSPLGSWFSDMAKGYRAWDSFFDNIDFGSLIGGGITAFATGYLKDGLSGGISTALLSVMGNLLGTDLSGLGSTWGSDLIKGMASGMVTVAAKAGWLTKAAKFVGSVIRAFLHFSRPDKGPLRDYETWMPDMVHGMADSLKNNAYVLRNAARDVSSDLQTQMQYDVGMASPSYEQNYKSSTVKLGGVTMTIQAQPGMDEEKLARYTIDRLSQMINEEAASSGQIPVF